MPTIKIIIKGKVQGVFYRATAKKIARETDITGEIRNTGEGNVEAVVTGSLQNIESFIRWCKEGPPDAIVTHVEVTELPDQIFEDFSIVR